MDGKVDVETLPLSSPGSSVSRMAERFRDWRRFATTFPYIGETLEVKTDINSLGGRQTRIGRKFSLLISGNVVPVARLSISAILALLQLSMKKLEAFSLHFRAINPWFIATGMVAIAIYPMGARDDSSRVPAGRSPDEILDMPALVSLRSVFKRNGDAREEKSFGVVQWWIPPCQYSGSDVLGVAPPTHSTASPTEIIFHPLGILPSSESTKLSGKR